MLLGLAILSNPVVVLLYGAKWQAAALPLAFLTLAYALTAAIGLASELFILRHQTGRQVKIEAVRSTVGFLAFAAGATLNLQLAAAGKVVEALVALFLYRSVLGELLQSPEGALRKVYQESVLLTLAAVSPSLILMLGTGFSATTPISLILGSVVIGIVLWALLLLKLKHPLMDELHRLIKSRYPRRSAV
jgi:O-antigen/teichoic acid export membrane protein